MTDPKLREARIAEAKRRTEIDRKGSVSWSWKDTFANHLASLYEQDWRPEPEVDAVTLAFWEWDRTTDLIAERHLLGAFRAGHAHALANCADVRRVDWLEGLGYLHVDMSKPCGFLHCSTDKETLRAKIDRAMEGGE